MAGPADDASSNAATSLLPSLPLWRPLPPQRLPPRWRHPALPLMPTPPPLCPSQDAQVRILSVSTI